VAECREGIGSAEYTALLRTERSPSALLDRFMRRDHVTVHDQWQVQVQAMVQARYDVYLHSALPRTDVESAHLRFAPDVDATLAQIVAGRRRALGREPAVCVMPYGQFTVPRMTA